MRALFTSILVMAGMACSTGAFAQVVFQYQGSLQPNVTHAPAESYFKDAVLGDIDNDGDLDIYVLQKQKDGNTDVDPTTDLLFINNGVGLDINTPARFGLRTSALAFPATINGVPQDTIFTAKGYDGELVDLDEDGFLDIIRIDRGGTDPNGDYRHGTVHVMWGLGDGRFSPKQINTTDPNVIPCNASSAGDLNYDNVDVADLNGDGRLDFIVAQLNGCGSNLIVRNNGNRSFSIVHSGSGSNLGDLPAEFTHTVDIGDYNGDNIPDVILGKNNGVGGADIEVYRGTGNFRFTLAFRRNFSGVALQTTVSEFVDIDQDGDLDIIAGKDTEQVMYEHSGLPGNEPYPVQGVEQIDSNFDYLYDARVADLNNNLQMDWITIDHGKNLAPGFMNHYMSVFNWQGGALVDKKAQFLTEDHGIVGISFGDMDNDGDLDMITAGVGDPPNSVNTRSAIHIYENITDNVDLIQSQLPLVGNVVIHKSRVVVQRGNNLIDVDNYAIQPGAEVTFLAGNEVILREGFWAEDGSNFRTLLGNTLSNPDNHHGRGISAPPVAADASQLENNTQGLVKVYPNPFVHATTLRYQLAASQQVTVVVYDAQGRAIAMPLQEEVQPAGHHALELDMQALPDGLYYYRIWAGADGISGPLRKGSE